MTENKENLTIEEIFCGMPHLKEYFRQQEKAIKNFRKSKDKPHLSKELLIFKRDELLQTAQSLSRVELKIIYYLRQLSCVNELWFFHTLKNLYQMECDFKNSQQDQIQYVDVLQICKP